MRKNVKINNVLFENVLFVEKGDSTIFAKDIREEFFGVYNLNIMGKNIICESKSNDVVVCNLSVGNRVFENTSFKVQKSEKNQIVINLNNKQSYISEEVKRDAYDDLLIELKENEDKSKQELELIVEKAIVEKKKLSNEIIDLKKQINQIEKSNQKLVTEEKYNSHREDLLNEFFHIKDQNDSLIDEKMQSIHGIVMESVEKRLKFLAKEASTHFKKVNESQFEKMIDDVRYDVLNKNSKILEEKILELENLYLNEMDERLNVYSEANGRIFQDFNKAKKDTEIVLEKHLNESINILKENFNKLFEKYTHELKDQYSHKFENIIKQEKGNIKTESNKLFENQKKKVEDLLEEKSKEIEKKSNNIFAESSKKIKDVSKKLENIENQVNKNNVDKKKIESIIQDAKRYTDSKMEAVLNEAKRFTRVMMDMVGGGSGSVAVQYAAGGTINGDLTVTGALSSTSIDVGSVDISGGTINGNLDVTGTVSATTFLSGGNDLTNIFAGEGAGDENSLDGGLM